MRSGRMTHPLTLQMRPPCDKLFFAIVFQNDATVYW